MLTYRNFVKTAGKSPVNWKKYRFLFPGAIPVNLGTTHAYIDEHTRARIHTLAKKKKAENEDHFCPLPSG